MCNAVSMQVTEDASALEDPPKTQITEER
ncbi:hypothetical protein Tco_1276576, partial [Tanacetum coccineum]